jgi:hypothetical protein
MHKEVLIPVGTNIAHDPTSHDNIRIVIFNRQT